MTSTSDGPNSSKSKLEGRAAIPETGPIGKVGLDALNYNLSKMDPSYKTQKSLQEKKKKASQSTRNKKRVRDGAAKVEEVLEKSKKMGGPKKKNIRLSTEEEERQKQQEMDIMCGLSIEELGEPLDARRFKLLYESLHPEKKQKSTEGLETEIQLRLSAVKRNLEVAAHYLNYR